MFYNESLTEPVHDGASATNEAARKNPSPRKPPQTFHDDIEGTEERRVARKGTAQSEETLCNREQQASRCPSPSDKPDPMIITFTSTDPENPQNWPSRRKNFIVFSGIISVINSTLGSSLPAGAVQYIGEYFHVTSELQLVLPISCYLMGYTIGPVLCGPLSENFGRKPVLLVSFVIYILFTMSCAVAPNWPALLIFRVICGVFASAPIAIVGGMYADVHNDPHKRGMAMALFMAATTCGPILAPVISGFVAENTTWRWVFGVGTLFAVATLPMLVMIPESYAPILLARKAARLRRETGNQNIVAKSDLNKKSVSYVVTVVMTRPYRMLFQELIVSCTCAYLTLAYSIFYLYFEAYPIAFLGPDSVYKFSPGIAGLAFIPIGIGAATIIPNVILWDNYLAKATKQGKSWTRKEEYRRLPFACVGGPLYVISLFWLGWSARSDVHWIVPMLSGIPFGMGFLLIFMAMLNYLTDAYKVFAASAQGIASTCRSVGGVLLPLASRPMFRALGIGWACSLLGFASLAMATIPFFFIVYGEKIRANSAFCLALKEEEERQRREEEENKEKIEQGAKLQHQLGEDGTADGDPETAKDEEKGV